MIYLIAMKKYILSIFILLVVCSSVISQQEWQIYNTTNTGDNGLVGGYVSCFHKDQHNTLWIGTSYGISQLNDTEWNTINSGNGLPVDQVGHIVQDNDNNIWITHGSYGVGITRFDGKNFVTYHKSNGLLSDLVYDILVSQSGKIWLATNKGLSMFTGDHWINHPTEDDLPDLLITCIEEDSSGCLWLGSLGAGTFKFQNNSFTPFNWETNLNVVVYDIYRDVFGSIRVATDRNAFRYKNEWTEIIPFANGNDGAVYHINGDKSGRIFFSTSRGFAIWDNDTTMYFNKEDGLPHEKVTCSYISNDSIWIGGKDGCAVYYNDSWNKITTNDNGLICNRVNSASEIDSSIWFCTMHGVSKYNGVTWENYHYTESGKELRNVSGVLQDQDGNYWFGCYQGIFKFDGADWEVFDEEVDEMFLCNIRDVLKDSQGNLWFAGFNNLYKYDGSEWTHFDESNGFQMVVLNSLFEDSDGSIWIGTGAGITRYRDQEFEHFVYGVDLEGTGTIKDFIQNDERELFAIDEDMIYKYTNGQWESFQPGYLLKFGICDNENQLFIASFYYGLLKYDGERFNYLEPNYGLTFETIQSLCQAKDGVYYACTDRGIIKFTSKTIEDNNSRDSLVFSAFPNPTNGPLTITFPKKQYIISAEIYNQLGQRLTRKTFYGTYIINLELNQPTGIYYLKLESQSGKKGIAKILRR